MDPSELLTMDTDKRVVTTVPILFVLVVILKNSHTILQQTKHYRGSIENILVIGSNKRKVIA